MEKMPMKRKENMVDAKEGGGLVLRLSVPHYALLLSAPPLAACLPLPLVTSGNPCFTTILESAGMKWKREEKRAGDGRIKEDFINDI